MVACVCLVALWVCPSALAAPHASHAIAYVYDFGSGLNDSRFTGSSVFVNAVTGSPPGTGDTATYTGTTPAGTNTYSFTNVPIATLDANPTTALAPYDTVLLYEVCSIGDPGNAPALNAINTFLHNGGKIIILDADRCSPGNGGQPDYSHFTFPFQSSNPGPQGASGSYTSIEPSTLTAGLSTGSQTGDAVGDANILTARDPGWFAAISATNISGTSGPVEAYARTSTGGLALFQGEDMWFSFGANPHLKQVFDLLLGQEWDPDGLPSSNPIGGFCPEAGQMVNSAPLSYDKWTLSYGISKCEGLVASNVTLGPRLMAERMSLPYLNVKTCAGPDATHCGAITERHIVLRPSADEPQPDPSAYTHVDLQRTSTGGDVSLGEVKAPSYGPCYSNSLCDHQVVSATYRVDFAPASAGSAQNYLLVTQKYEFYRDFSEGGTHELACEPAKDTGLTAGMFVSGWLAAPLDDCGRWKALVSYDYVEGTSGQALVSVNAAQRLHFAPDATAIRASAFFRDCEPNSQTQCHDALGHLEELNQQTALQNEAIVRGFSDSPGGVVEGRFDNLHQTPANDVLKPGLNFTPLPHVAAGCPECVHMHWRWGQDILDARVSAAFGNGQPLVRDAEPAALPGPATTHQQLDVAQVAYHSEELAPTDYTQLVAPGESDAAIERQLDVSFANGSYTGGSVSGAEQLEYPSGSCAVPDDPATWGQCGEVTWLSATSFNDAANHERKDTFFAFGGFFCAACSNQNYSNIVGGATPHYVQSLTRSCQLKIVFLPVPVPVPCETTKLKSGQRFHVIFANGSASGEPSLQVSDALPPGTTNVAGQVLYADKGSFLGIGSGVKTQACAVGTASNGASLVQCTVPDNIASFGIDISGTGPTQPVTETNGAHTTWGDGTTNSEFGGNFKTVTSLSFSP